VGIDLGTREIRIDGQTLAIGHQVYNLSNVVKIGVFTYPAFEVKSKVRPSLGVQLRDGAMVMAAFILGIPLAFALFGGEGGAGWLGALMGFGAWVWLGLALDRKRKRVDRVPPLHTILLTMSSGRTEPILQSPDLANMHDWQSRIGSAWTSPPRTAHTWRVDNVVLGDLINQQGNWNTGRIG
jgi:Family of unknown function (DUF6232)